MSIILNDNLSIQAPKPVDAKYGPYADTATANSAISSANRYAGLTVGIGTATIIDYWYNGGITDANLVAKTSQIQVDWNQTTSTALDYIKNKPAIPATYSLPTASSTTLGGIKVGSNLTINTDTLTYNAAGAETLTNKRIQPRVQPITVASGSTTQTWSSNSYDQINLTLSNTATVTLQLDTGTPTDGQKIMFRIKDDGTSRTIAFTSTGTNCFRNAGTSITLAGTATTASKLMYVGCIYNSSGTGTWDIVAYGQEV